MPFRDELEAARARIEKLDRDLAALKAEREKEQHGEPPFAIATVVLALLVVGMGAGMAMLWNRVSEAEEAAASWRELEGQTGHELHEAQVRLDEARRATAIGPDWFPEAERRGRAWARGGSDTSEEWTGHVIERIGDAPAAIGQLCTFVIARTEETPRPYAPFQCRARVRCGDVHLYPAASEPDLVTCSFGPSGSVRPIAPVSPTSVRLTGHAGDLRIDDGPTGTWSLRIADSR